MDVIDISNHNGSIDFNKVKAAGIDTIIMKATEGGSYIDPMLEENYKQALGKGFNIGFYHFLYELSDPKRQANWFWQNIKDKEFNVIPVLDAERNNNNKFNKETYTKFCLDFLEEFKRLSGIDCILYTYTSFANSLMDSRLKPYKLWEANYYTNNGQRHNRKGLTNIWGKDIVGHQYTSTGRVNGINTNCDLNDFEESILLNKSENLSKPVNNPVKGESKLLEQCKSNVLTFGEKGTYVYLAQSAMKALGLYNGPIDGSYGPAKGNGSFYQAVVNLNSKLGYKNDSRLGPACWTYILTK
jgi:GH25 family lysozyme M1 (1,4-beta-N-acetylmuramidase)